MISIILGMVIEEARTIFALPNFFDRPVESPIGAIKNLWQSALTEGKGL